MNKKGVILLSSGLDSIVALDFARDFCEIKLALTFDYGQKAAKEEIEASKKICLKYDIPHKTIELPFLKEITNNSLTNKDLNLEFEKSDENSAKNVWVPNRNGLFANIGASYAESFDYDYIIMGLNREEAETFPDNSIDFIEKGTDLFKFSTLSHPEIYAPLYNLTKNEIVSIGVVRKVDFSLIRSCYDSSDNQKTHCGKCESCIRLKNALINTNNSDLLKIIF